MHTLLKALYIYIYIYIFVGDKCFEIFWYVQVFSFYLTLQKQFKPWKRPAVVGSIMVVDWLTCWVTLHIVCD